MTLAGRQLGRYKILDQLGQGGMSVVYRGLDTVLQREVAVKVLHPHLARRPESRARLEREARAVARLHHPGILEVYDVSMGTEDAPEAYLVTELIHGKTLRDWLAETALRPPELGALVGYEVARALAHAHEAGVIHRDLKPENVMVRRDGALKLMDFGIARILDQDDRMTLTGALVGSPAHMAPEIIEGQEAGAEADVFSLGTMLYLFVTGKLPFLGANTTATLKRIVDGAYVDPRQLVPTVSDELAEIIGTCLQRQPQDRYAHAGRVAEALHAYLADLGLERTDEELGRFFVDPSGYAKALTPRLVARLLDQARAAVAARKMARALSALNLVLAHDPTNAEAEALVGQARTRVRAAKRGRWARRALAAAVGTVALAAVGRAVVLRTSEPLAAAPPSPPVGAAPVAPPPPLQAAAVLPVVEVTPLQPQAAEPERPRPAQRRPGPPAAPQRVELQVMIRPFGHLFIDGVQASSEALAIHTAAVTPGLHRFEVRCDLCEPTSKEVTVFPGDRAPVTLVASLKPSLVSFHGYPAEAVVRVGAEQRTAEESERTPFRITTPADGNREMRHLVSYEVTLKGELLDKGSRRVVPGRPEIISRRTP